MIAHHIQLADEDAAFLNLQIEQGRFANLDQALTEALHLLQESIEHEKQQMPELRRALQAAAARGYSPRSHEEIWAAARDKIRRAS